MSTAISPARTREPEPSGGDEAQQSWLQQLPATVLRALLTQRIVLLLVLLVAVLHLTGNSPGGPGSHLGLAAAPTVAQDLAPGAASPC